MRKAEKSNTCIFATSNKYMKCINTGEWYHKRAFDYLIWFEFFSSSTNNNIVRMKYKIPFGFSFRNATYYWKKKNVCSFMFHFSGNGIFFTEFISFYMWLVLLLFSRSVSDLSLSTRFSVLLQNFWSGFFFMYLCIYFQFKGKKS